MDRPPTVFVLAPDPLLTITVETGTAGAGDEIHLHPGGQGFWLARMAAALGADVTIGGPFGGESGAVTRGLLADAGIGLHPIAMAGPNGAYIHDRRAGERVEVATMCPGTLSRHEIDDLYGAALLGGLESEVTVLGGPGPWDPPVLPAEIYRRLSADLRANGRTVVADVSGPPLPAALAGGLTVLKVSHEQLIEDGFIDGDELDQLVEAMSALRKAGADHVIVSRADQPALVLVEDGEFEVVGPVLDPVEHRGAGDSMTAGVAAGLAHGLTLPEAIRLGAAAGALNVTRHGLASGNRAEIERLAAMVELRPLRDTARATTLGGNA